MSFLNIFTDLFDWYNEGGTFQLWFIVFFFTVVFLIAYQFYFGFKNKDKGQGLGRQSWKIDLEEDLVRLIKTKELNDFWNKEIDFIVGPGESAVLVRDGRIEDVVTQKKLSGVAGGFKNWLGQNLRSKSDLDLLFVDNKPFQIDVGVDGLTKDDLAQKGIAKLTLRLEHEKSNRIIGMLREREIRRNVGFFRRKVVVDGYETAMTKSEIEQMISEEARSTIFNKIIRKYEAKDLGSSDSIDEEISTASRLELKKTLDLWGMNIENIYVSWSLNAFQVWRAQRAPTTWMKDAEMEEAEKEMDKKIEYERRRRQRLRAAEEDELMSDVEFQKKKRIIERQLEEQEREFERSSAEKDREFEHKQRQWEEEDEQRELEKEQNQLDLKEAQAAQLREIEAKELEHKKKLELESVKTDAEIEAIKSDSEISKKRKSMELEGEMERSQSERDREEMEGLLSVKEKMASKKLEAKKMEQEHELELAKVQADVDKTVGVAEAKAKIPVLVQAPETEQEPEAPVSKFMVEAVYLVYNDGRLLNHAVSEKQQTDAEILTSMLSAVNDFVGESLGKEGTIGNLQFGDNTIVIEKGKNCYIAAMAHGSTTKDFRSEVKKLVSKIEMDHVKDLTKWNGDVSLFENRNTDLVKIMLQSTAKDKSEI
jgi:hypothetical protein